MNYHRPCAQPDTVLDEKGRKRTRYRSYKTPLETLAAMENPDRFLRNGLTVDDLKRVQMAKSDTDAARAMQQAKGNRQKLNSSTGCSLHHEQKGAENDDLWKAQKTKIPFPDLPINLGNRTTDFHIPSASTANDNLTKFRTERTFQSSPDLRPLQAHPAIGKDYPSGISRVAATPLPRAP